MRKTALKRGKPLTRSTPVRKRNPERQQKRAKAYKSFLSSAVWKRIRREAIERAGGRCENVYIEDWRYVFTDQTVTMVHVRCTATENLTVDHLTYARFGGKELPEDLKVLCRDCHNRRHALEGKKMGSRFLAGDGE